jgi:hypothetical protein
MMIPVGFDLGVMGSVVGMPVEFALPFMAIGDAVAAVRGARCYGDGQDSIRHLTGAPHGAGRTR